MEPVKTQRMNGLNNRKARTQPPRMRLRRLSAWWPFVKAAALSDYDSDINANKQGVKKSHHGSPRIAAGWYLWKFQAECLNRLTGMAVDGAQPAYWLAHNEGHSTTRMSSSPIDRPSSSTIQMREQTFA
jgi:hypothetical protein